MICSKSSRPVAEVLTLLMDFMDFVDFMDYMVNISSNSCRLLSTALDRRKESVRRDAERGGRDDRAPQGTGVSAAQ
jgi:hypothetical protein